MRSFYQKRNSNKFYSQIAQKIGTSIRKQIIQSKRLKLPQKQYSLDRINKIKVQKVNPQDQYWTNPYKTQKTKWNFTYSRYPYIYQKQDIGNYNKYQLQKFKHKLKTLNEQRQEIKQEQIKENKLKVKQLRINLNQNCQQKVQQLFYHKQYQADTLRRYLYNKKTQSKLLKRKLQLDMQFNKWHRQQTKLINHRNQITNQQQRFKTTVN